MRHFQRAASSSATPTNSPQSAPESPVEIIKKELVTARGLRTLAASSSAVALSIGSPSCDPRPSDTSPNEPGSSEESGWKTAYGAAKIAIEIAKESSDMFLPLKAVVGALTVLIKNYDVSPPQVFHPAGRRLFLTANNRQHGADQRHRRKGAVTC